MSDEIHHREAHAHDHGDAVEDVEIGNREHAGERGVGDAESRRDHAARRRGDACHQRQEPAATAELVRRNRRVRDDRRDGGQHARHRAVAQFENVGHRVLRDPAHARRDDVDERDADPRAGRLPQCRETGAVAERRARKEGSRSDPRRQQREREHAGRKRPAGDEEVVARLHPARSQDARASERGEVAQDCGKVDVHRP